MRDNSFIQKFKTSSNSVKWTSLFAVIAVASILAIGLKPVSFAADTGSLPDTVKTGTVDTGQVIYHGIEVEQFFLNDGVTRVYCLEKNKAFGNNTIYTKSNSLEQDYGLTYILSHTYPNVDDGSNKNYQVWVAQVAIWYYLDQISAEELSAAKAQSTWIPGLWSKVESLVTAAKQITEPADLLSFNINAEFSTTSDGLYLISNLIEVTALPSDIFQNYDILIEGAPTGTVILNTAGQEISVLSGLTATKFYIQVPIENITNDTQNFVIKLKGYYKHYRPYKYTGASASDQPIVLVEPYTKTLETAVPVNVKQKVEVPDTAKSSGKAIYFIGLIILLSGAGIIYANVKPREQR